jgi:L-rhamnose mutarotase
MSSTQQGVYPGRRLAQIVRLKPEYVAEYKECHSKVWPEVLKQIKDCNIEDCMSYCLFSAFFLTPGAYNG